MQKYIRCFQPQEHDQISQQPMCSIAHLGLDLLRLDASLNSRFNLDKEQCIEDVRESVYARTKKIGLEDATKHEHSQRQRSPLISLLRLTHSLIGLLTMTTALCSPLRTRTLACCGVSVVLPISHGGLKCSLSNLIGGESHT